MKSNATTNEWLGYLLMPELKIVFAVLLGSWLVSLCLS